MENIPLVGRLKRRIHRQVAFAQDVLVAEIYDALPESVLHGGTAIWRCYGGTRFSEDVDAYLPSFSAHAGGILRRGLAAKGMKELKFKATGNTVFGKFALGGAQVRLEGAVRRPPTSVIRGYETLEGGRMMVSTLPVDDLLLEKAEAYASRRKARDLYDVFFLVEMAEDKTTVEGTVMAFLKSYRPPVDEPTLKTVVLVGAVPTAEQMVEGLKRWARKST